MGSETLKAKPQAKPGLRVLRSPWNSELKAACGGGTGLRAWALLRKESKLEGLSTSEDEAASTQFHSKHQESEASSGKDHRMSSKTGKTPTTGFSCPWKPEASILSLRAEASSAPARRDLPAWLFFGHRAGRLPAGQAYFNQGSRIILQHAERKRKVLMIASSRR